MNSRILFAVGVSAIALGMGTAAAQDNAVLRRYLAKEAKEALSKYDSQEDGWHSEKSESKKKKVRGIVIARWTEESKTWLWIDNPAENLSVEVTRFDLDDDKLKFAVTAKAKVKGKAWGKIPNVVKGDVGMSARVKLTIEGEAKIGADRFERVDVHEVSGSLSDLRLNNDLLNALSGLIEACANEYAKSKDEDLAGAIEKGLKEARW